MSSKFLKAITLHQPWASLIAAGLKTYETRDWKTGYRGLIAIHAGKKWTNNEIHAWGNLRRRFKEIRENIPDENLPLGAVVCVCKLVDIWRTESLVGFDAPDEIDEMELAVGDWSEGRYAWELEVVKVPDFPIPARGEKGIWNWEVVIDE